MEPQDPSTARLIFGVVAASGAEVCHWNVDQVSPSLIGQWISLCFSMDAANTALGPRCGHHRNVQLLSNTTVQVRCSYDVLFSSWIQHSRRVLGLHQAAETHRKLGQRKQWGAASDNAYMSDYSCFRVLSLTDYNSRAKQESNTILAMHSGMDVHYRRKVMPTSAVVQLPR